MVAFLKNPALGWCCYRDANPVPTITLADDIATAPSRSVFKYLHLGQFNPTLKKGFNVHIQSKLL